MTLFTKLLTVLGLTLTLFSSSPGWALQKVGRLGVGYSQQLVNDLPSASVKLQQNRYFALGAILGLKSNEDYTLYGAGLRVYRVIFEEERLNFYLAGTAASLRYLENNQAKSGYQFDALLGTEFHFEGIESLGFSFEVGASANKTDEGRNIEILGNNFLRSAVHFYL